MEITAFLAITDQHTPSPCVAPITPMVSGDNYYKYSGGDNYKYKQLKHAATPSWLAPVTRGQSGHLTRSVTTRSRFLASTSSLALFVIQFAAPILDLRFTDYLQPTENGKHLLQHEMI